MNTDPKCANFASKFTGTKCAASCDPVLEIQMCTSDGECPSGKKCIPFGSKGNQVGGCEKLATSDRVEAWLERSRVLRAEHELGEESDAPGSRR